MSDLADNILEHLRANGPSKAQDIATALGIDRTVVNQTLYGALRAKVRQAKDFRWSVGDLRGPATVSKTTDAVASSYRGLFNYYLDCLAQDDDSGVSVLAQPPHDLDYVELPVWPFDGAASDNNSDSLRKLIGRQRRDARKKTLWLG